MALPTLRDVHVDAALTNISVAFMQNASNFVSRRVFPNVPVSKQSDKYFIYDRGDFNRDQAKKRAPGTESAGGGFGLSTATYSCDVWAWHKDVPLQIASNQDVGDPYDDAARFVMQTLMIRQEAEFNSTFMTGGVWDTDYDGTAASPASNETIHWSDTTNGDPIGDIRSSKSTVLQNTGYKPNTLVIGTQVFDALVDHPDIVDRIKYSGGVGSGNPAVVNEQTLAALFGLERVLVSEAVQNTAAEDATDSHSFIVGKDALLVYATPNPGLLVPSAGYTFSWRGYLGTANDMGIATGRIPAPLLKAERVEGEIAMDQKVVSSALGAFWDNIVS